MAFPRWTPEHSYTVKCAISMATCPMCSFLKTDWAARIPDKTQLADWATGPYFPYPYLNITGHVRVRSPSILEPLS